MHAAEGVPKKRILFLWLCCGYGSYNYNNVFLFILGLFCRAKKHENVLVCKATILCHEACTVLLLCLIRSGGDGNDGNLYNMGSQVLSCFWVTMNFQFFRVFLNHDASLIDEELLTARYSTKNPCTFWNFFPKSASKLNALEGKTEKRLKSSAGTRVGQK